MVMFTCNRCSAGLKKNQVESHAFKCGGPSRIDLTCHDCLKDFRGKEYESHTSCVTEEARYGGKNVVVKEAGKKQNKWCEVVQNVLTNNKNLALEVHRFLKEAVRLPNIPRKKQAFQNWSKNCLKWASSDLVDRVFDLLINEFTSANSLNNETSTAKSKTEEMHEMSSQRTADGGDLEKEQNGSVGNADNEESNENPRKKKKDKKHKRRENGGSVSQEEITLNGNGTEEVVENGQSPPKKKKKKKTSDITEEVLDDVDVPEGNSECQTVQNGKTKKSKQSECFDDKSEDCVDEAVEDQPPETHDQKLSKKELKRLKKRTKFEAEVAAIASSVKPEDDDVEEDKRKGKKRKNEERADAEEKPKKSKKRQNEPEEADGDEGDESKRRKTEVEEGPREEEEANSPAKLKFQWHDTILAVLKKSKNDEVPVKKVTKRVIDEYLTQYGDKGIHEKLQAKMNKKLQTCPGIRVLKDRVKLLDGDR